MAKEMQQAAQILDEDMKFSPDKGVVTMINERIAEIDGHAWRVLDTDPPLATASAPARSRRRASSTFRTPPPTASGIKTRRAARSTVSTIRLRRSGGLNPGPQLSSQARHPMRLGNSSKALAMVSSGVGGESASSTCTVITTGMPAA